LQTSPVFARLGREQRAELARQFRLMEVQPDTILIEQGQRAEALYVVLAGELSAIAMESDGDKELAVLGAGAPCGEMSLLQDAPAIASIVARRKSWVLLLPRSDFERSLALHPALHEGLRQIANDRRGNNLIGFDSSDLEML
jgi:CRP-like cAMP-binding protein